MINWTAETCSGVNSDIAPAKLPPSVWTSANNIRFVDGQSRKRDGQAEVLYSFSTSVGTVSPANTGDGTLSGIATYDTTVAEVITLTATGATTFTVSGSVTGSMDSATVGTAYSSPQISFLITAGATPFVSGDSFPITITKNAPADTINHVLPWSTTTTNYWVWCSLTNAYRWNGTTHTDVTRVSGGDYTADADVQWTSTILGEVVCLNNGADLPQYLGTAGSAFANFPTGGSDWVSTVRCKSLRSFKSYLVALNITDGASTYPQNVRWSTSADPGSLPQWDITDPTLEAGETSLSETDGEVIDGLSLGDSFMIYKDDSVWGMQVIGGQFVMRFYKVFGDKGILTTNCVTSYNGLHFVADKNDVYIHNGSSPQSVISGRVRKTLFQQLDDDYINRCYCITDHRNAESLFCFVSAGSGASYPNKALVYNWESKEVSFRDLPGSGHMGFGAINANLSADDWDSDDGTWESDDSEWGAVEGKPTERRLLIPDTANMVFYGEGLSNTDGGTAFASYVEKVGIAGDDTSTMKHLYTMYPLIEGSGTVTIYGGGERRLNEGYTWSSGTTFTLNSDDVKVEFQGVYGRSLAIRIESAEDSEYSVSGYTLEGKVVGKR